MADLRLAPSTLKKALDNLFSDATEDSYSIILTNDGSTISGLSSETCVFESAEYDSTNKQAYVQLQSPVYFEIDSGTIVNGLNLLSEDGAIVTIYISNEAIEERTYTANGTYTVSDLIIRIGE